VSTGSNVVVIRSCLRTASTPYQVAHHGSLMIYGTNNIATLTADFAVPIHDESGKTVLIKLVSFVDGIANTTLRFNYSGYYRITQSVINGKLSYGQKISLPLAFEITAYE